LLIHLLPCLDFDELAASNPKWILGYSDTSTLLFVLTIVTGVATAHGTTLMEMVPNQSGNLSQRWQEVVSTEKGKQVELRSSESFQINGPNWQEDPASVFNLTEPTLWRCRQHGHDCENLSFRGRLIGGCLETLAGLVGTPYGDLARFKHRFRQEGVILYLENAESTPPVACRMLWNMRLAGWFDGLRGILLGRSGGPERKFFSYSAALQDALDELPIPIIYDADIGHCPPQMTLINGAVATVESSAGRGNITLALA
jgi:muramoyltetrapeptide carboxypeptidase LdcA involved in peptidoglycan recycling